MQTSFLDVARQRRRYFSHGKKRQPEIGLHSQAALGDLWTRFEGMDKQRWIVVLHVAFLSCHAMLPPPRALHDEKKTAALKTSWISPVPTSANNLCRIACYTF